MEVRFLLLSMLLAGTAMSIKVTPNMKTFGHSIKNGHLLPRGNEITTFEHNCTAPPCAIPLAVIRRQTV